MASTTCAARPGARPAPLQCRRQSHHCAAVHAPGQSGRRGLAHRSPASAWGQGAARVQRSFVDAPPAAAGAPARSVAAAATVRVAVPECRLAFGENLKIVGAPAELGGWDAAAAPALQWGEGDNWSAALELPAGEHLCKLVIVRQDGSQQWEEGGDRRLPVPSGAAALQATCRFGDTNSTQLQGAGDDGLQPVQAAAEKAAARVAELRQGVADLTRRKQQLADRLAGLERSLQNSSSSRSSSSSSSSSSYGSQWQSGDSGSGGGGGGALASPAVALASALLLAPLAAGTVYVGAKSQGIPVDSYLPKQVPAALEASLSKLNSLQASLPQAPAPAPVASGLTPAGYARR